LLGRQVTVAEDNDGRMFVIVFFVVVVIGLGQKCALEEQK
jgi:hypothetical protein